MDFHARAVLEHPDAELVAAANWREPSLRRLAERHGIARVTTDWHALAADPEVDAGELGTIVKTRGYGGHARWGPSGWFTDLGLAGGGALLDMGVHAIDTTRHLLGDRRPARVCAAVGTRYGDYAVDDDAVLLIGWSNDTNSVVESGWWQPKVGGLEADTELYGTGGYARVWEGTEPPPDYEHCTQPMYSAQLAEFVEAVTAGRQPRPSGEDGRVVVEIVEQAYAAAGSRQG
jgi:predicted dehydrogenase